MYSVVLMMALTGGGDVPAGLLGGHGCCGGCYGGCYGGCHGCHGGHRQHGCCGGGYGCCGGHKHHRGHGCCGGCYGCYGCCGGCYGGCYGYGCCGGCYGGCYGGACYGGACFGGCVGGVGGVIGGGAVVPGTVVPSTPTTPAKPADGNKTSLEGAAPATLVVNVPADARLTIDGEVTTSTSTQRVFVSPALEPGRDYHYTLKAEFAKDGKVVSVSKKVAIQAGNETRVTLDADSVAEVASR